MRCEPWPAERAAQLQAYVASGLSASQISEAFDKDGFEASRNAIIGKVHRMKLALNGITPPKRWSARADEIVRKNWDIATSPQIVEMLAAIGLHFTPSAVRMRALKITEVRKGKGSAGRHRASPKRRPYEPPPPPPEARMVGLLDLDAHDCSFPIGDPKQPGFGFCGAHRAPGGSYCKYHHRIAYQPDSEMRVARQNGLARYIVDRPFVSGMAL